MCFRPPCYACREQAVDQLKGTKAGDAERKQVLQLLQRVHEQQLQEDDQMMREALGIPGASSSSYIQEDDEGGDDGAEAQGEQGQTEENRDVVLTRETLERLALKVSHIITHWHLNVHCAWCSTVCMHVRMRPLPWPLMLTDMQPTSPSNNSRCPVQSMPVHAGTAAQGACQGL